MKHMKKVLLLSTLLLLMALTPLTVNAASAKTKALKAYSKFLSKSKLAETGLQSSLCDFSLAYIDSNSVPELVIRSYERGSLNGYFSVYTYQNKKVKLVRHLLGTGFGYYKKKGVFQDVRYLTVPQGGPGMITTHYKLSKGKNTSSVSKQKLEANPRYGRKKNKTTYGTWQSNWSEMKKVSKSSYNKSLKKMIGSKTLITESSMTFYDNTKANRKKHLK